MIAAVLFRLLYFIAIKMFGWLGVGAEQVIHGSDLRPRWTVAVRHDR